MSVPPVNSIEFTGGTLIQVQTKEAVGTERIRSALDAAGIRDAEIQQFGGPTEYKIQARIAKEGVAEGSTEATAAAVDSALARGLGSGPEHYTIVRTEAVGPKVGRELQGKAFLAIFFSFIVTLFYLAFRFEWRFGLAAVLATFHDILTTIAFIRYLDLEVSLVVVGAVLTMVGYSLNDTIIIFDRVRENLHKFRRQNLYEILNLSINETLPRSVLTHGTTMATTIALVLLAGEVLRPFALVMTFAIFTGTFSSIYIAAPLLMYIEKRWPGEDARGARALRPPGSVPLNPPPATPGGGRGRRPPERPARPTRSGGARGNRARLPLRPLAAGRATSRLRGPAHPRPRGAEAGRRARARGRRRRRGDAPGGGYAGRAALVQLGAGGVRGGDGDRGVLFLSRADHRQELDDDRPAPPPAAPPAAGRDGRARSFSRAPSREAQRAGLRAGRGRGARARPGRVGRSHRPTHHGQRAPALRSAARDDPLAESIRDHDGQGTHRHRDRSGGRAAPGRRHRRRARSEEHTSELQSPCNLVCRLLLEKKKK